MNRGPPVRQIVATVYPCDAADDDQWVFHFLDVGAKAGDQVGKQGGAAAAVRSPTQNALRGRLDARPSESAAATSAFALVWPSAGSATSWNFATTSSRV